MGAFDAVLIQIDEKGADPARAAVRIARAGKDHGRVGLAGEAHRGFLAIQPPAFAGFLGLQNQVRRIRSAARLGQAKANDGLTRNNLGHPFRRDVPGGVLGDHAAHERTQKLHIADIEIGIGDFFDDHPRRDRAFTHSAEFFGQIDADQA